MSTRSSFLPGKNFYRWTKIFLVGLTLLSTVLLAACGSGTQPNPYIYGVWSAFGQPMTSIVSLSQDAKKKVVVMSDSKGLTLNDFTTKHNYSYPISPEGNYVAVYNQNSQGQWMLNVLQTSAGSAAAVYQRAIDSTAQSSPYIEGFSPSGRYYAYSIVDSNTGLVTVEVFDLQKKVLLNSMPSSYFIDFLPQNDQMIILSLGPSGALSGVQSVSLPDETQTPLFQPGQDEKIGALIVSPDGKYLYYSDINSESVYRRPFSGGDRELVYHFESGDQHFANFDEYGHYLMLTTATNSAVSFILLDSSLKQVLSVPSISSDAVAFSPDGNYLAFQAVNGDKTVLWLADIKNQKYLQISDTGLSYQPEFTADSQYLAFLEISNSTDNIGNLQLFNVNSANNEQIATNVTSFMIRSDSLVYRQVDPTQSSPTSSLFTVPIDKPINATLLSGPENGILKLIK
ncbi:MAG TPA: WD40 repeat domain-containing protein [Longilinea sp.]|nr:WD40 repeat domain-containing protein [Longilinea sp.]